MSITITYSGKLNNPQDWAVVTDEMKLWSNRVGWQWLDFDRHILGQTTGVYRQKKKLPDQSPIYMEDRRVDERWRGIRMQPTGLVESFFMAFNRKGKIVSYWDMPPLEDGTARYMHFVRPWVTTHRSLDAHIEICKILHYLKETYISNLKVRDEAKYFNKQDPAVFEESQVGMLGFVLGLAELLKDTGVELKTSLEMPLPPHPDTARSINEN